MQFRSIGWWFGVGLCFSQGIHAGYYLEHEAILPSPQSPEPIRATLQSWLQGTQLKRRSSLQNTTLLIDTAKETIIGIDEAARTYWLMDARFYRDFAANLLLVYGLQPNADGAVEVPDVLFVPTGQRAQIAGRRAEEFRIQGRFPPGMQSHIWVSKEVPLEPKLWSSQMRVVLGAPDHPSYQRFFQQGAALPGYPVQSVTTVITAGGTAVSSETLVLFREENLPASTFAVPPGFREVTAPFSKSSAAPRVKERSSPAGIDAPL